MHLSKFGCKFFCKLLIRHVFTENSTHIATNLRSHGDTL